MLELGVHAMLSSNFPPILGTASTASTAVRIRRRTGSAELCLIAPVEKPPGSGGAAIYQLVEQSSLASLVLLASACSRL